MKYTINDIKIGTEFKHNYSNSLKWPCKIVGFHNSGKKVKLIFKNGDTSSYYDKEQVVRFLNKGYWRIHKKNSNLIYEVYE